MVRGRSEERNVMQIGSFASSKEDDCTQAFLTQKKQGSNELITRESFSLGGAVMLWYSWRPGCCLKVRGSKEAG